MRQNIEASLTRLYVQNNPTVPIDDIIESVKLQTDAYMRQFTIEDNDLAVSISVKAPQKIVNLSKDWKCLDMLRNILVIPILQNLMVLVSMRKTRVTTWHYVRI